nr:FxsA family protein [Methanosarcina horonobensis]
MFLRLFSLFLIIPLVEIYLLVKIGGIIGALNTVLIILITATLGAYLTKSQASGCFSRSRTQPDRGTCLEMNFFMGSLY